MRLLLKRPIEFKSRSRLEKLGFEGLPGQEKHEKSWDQILLPVKYFFYNEISVYVDLSAHHYIKQVRVV